MTINCFSIQSKNFSNCSQKYGSLKRIQRQGLFPDLGAEAGTHGWGYGLKKGVQLDGKEVVGDVGKELNKKAIEQEQGLEGTPGATVEGLDGVGDVLG